MPEKLTRRLVVALAVLAGLGLFNSLDVRACFKRPEPGVSPDFLSAQFDEI